MIGFSKIIANCFGEISLCNPTISNFETASFQKIVLIISAIENFIFKSGNGRDVKIFFPEK